MARTLLFPIRGSFPLGFRSLSSAAMAPARGGGKRPREAEPDEMQQTVILLCSSSDDEEANVDLSARIVERARKREEERSATRRNLEASKGQQMDLVDLDSSEDLDSTFERSNGKMREESTKKNKKKRKKREKKKKKQRGESGGDDDGAGREHETGQTPIKINEEESVVTGSAVPETNEDISDNIVFRKLLRGPRYFEPGSTRLETCYNCGEEGHLAAVCTAEKRKKPCFVCGMFGHNARKCSQGQDCYICKQRGHLARDCPDKHRADQQHSRVCIRCGGLGHEMSSCKNDYPLEDLKNIQCYVCKDFGHFCCAEFVDTSPGKILCYNCGDSGHSGMGCAKPWGEAIVDTPAKSCYICGEEGHFARGCTRRSSSSSSKHEWQQRESFSSTPKSASHSKKRKDMHSIGNSYKKKTHGAENGRSVGSRVQKSMVRGGWIVDDDPRDFDQRSRWSPRAKPWNSPYTPRTPPLWKSFNRYNDRY